MHKLTYWNVSLQISSKRISPHQLSNSELWSKENSKATKQWIIGDAKESLCRMSQHPRDLQSGDVPLFFSVLGTICRVIMGTWQISHKHYVKNKNKDQTLHAFGHDKCTSDSLYSKFVCYQKQYFMSPFNWGQPFFFSLKPWHKRWTMVTICII